MISYSPWSGIDRAHATHSSYASHPSPHASETAPHIHIDVLGGLVRINDLEVVNQLLDLRATLGHGSQNVKGCAV